MLLDLVRILIAFALIAYVLFDVFQTLFNPRRVGSPSQRVMNAIWSHSFSKRFVNPDVNMLIGPIFILCVLLSWLVLTLLGWALIYSVYLPGEAVLLSTGMLPADQSGFLDALYYSAVVQTTLGLGDIAPTSDFLRIVVPLQAALGFALLTAGITWVLGIYPALVRRQQFTHFLHTVRRELESQGFAHPELAESEVPGLARNLASQLMLVMSDLLQFPITFYFHDHDAESSLPDVLQYLPELIESGRRQDGSISSSVGILKRALEDFSATLESRFPIESDDGDVLGEYARSAGYARDPDEPAAEGQR